MEPPFDSMPGLHAPAALLADGWAPEVAIRFGADGRIRSVERDARPDGLPLAAGPVLPGAVNVHSHAFQRALTGRTQRLEAADDFWTWRRAMYRLADVLTPDDVQAVTARAYMEMLTHGYTAVGEFHYLHHDRSGNPYSTPEETSLRIARAARTAGIGLTLLPSLYRWAGFDREPASGPAARFRCDPDLYARILEGVREAARLEGFDWGVAPHSLRAVAPDDLRRLCELAPDAPIHLHTAEQRAEVDACLAHTGQSPIAWLLRHADLDARWCLIHATHGDVSEYRALAATGTCVGLCPTTEGDLGDGFFPLRDWLAREGRFAIGSDSQVSVSPGEELRTMLYAERSRIGLRGVLPGPLSHGTALWRASSEHGARAIGRAAGRIEPGLLADLVVLDASAPLFAGLAVDEAAGAFALSGGAAEIERVIVAGRPVVVRGSHPRADAVRRDWDRTAARIRESLA